MDPTEVVENFFGVYLLKSLNPKYNGRTYIGFTVDPKRRIKQHNRGKEHGGAWRTSHRGPWEMVLIVHGFPSEISALRFEWAWQHPKKSRRLKNVVPCKRSSETSLQYRIRIMFLMLLTPPWNRLPLVIRWMSAEVAVDAPVNLTPPSHMSITYGSVASKKIKGSTKSSSPVVERKKPQRCQICETNVIADDELNCVNTNCTGIWHIFCIADKFLEDEMALTASTSSQASEKQKKHILPVEGSCPECHSFVLWGDLIRKKNGCYSQINDSSASSS